MGEYSFALLTKFESKDERDKFKNKMEECTERLGPLTGESLRNALAQEFGEGFSEYIFSPFVSDDDFDKLKRYVADYDKAKEYWWNQQAMAKCKDHRWVSHDLRDLIGWAIFPHEIEDSDDLTLRLVFFEMEVEDLIIMSAYLARGINENIAPTKVEGTELFDGDEY